MANKIRNSFKKSPEFKKEEHDDSFEDVSEYFSKEETEPPVQKSLEFYVGAD